MDRNLITKIKCATVALAVIHEADNTGTRMDVPFTILGSGFCVHPRGVIVTCRHVFEAFVANNLDDLLESIPDEEKRKEIQRLPPVEMIRPHVLFYDVESDPENLKVIVAAVETGFAKTDCDLALLRVTKHAAFPNGYPTIEVEEHSEIYEGMELGTCGFPLGNYLAEQIGTVTSSFTKGTLSSVSPGPNIDPELIRYYQLDLTATHGNSGGPVFSWESGRVFGVLQGGVWASDRSLLAGIAKAEPLGKVLSNDEVERLLKASIEDLR